MPTTDKAELIEQILSAERLHLAQLEQERDVWERSSSAWLKAAIDHNQRAEAAESRVSHLEQENARLRTALETMQRLAKEATNGWACYARRQIEHDDITRLHREIDDLAALLAVPPGGQETP